MHDSANSHEAILFFQDGEIQKEMTFAEFEAVLDGIVGLDDLAGEVMQAAFVMVSSRLAVKGIALFEIGFDESGYADPKWNIPLRTLVDKSEPGPDLGGGPVRIAYRSRCPLPAHKDSLWDPSADTLKQIRTTVSENRLCLSVDESPAPSSSSMGSSTSMGDSGLSDALMQNLESEHRSKLAALMRQQQSQLESLTSESQTLISDVNHSRNKEVALASMQLEKLREEHDKLQSQYITLTQQYDSQRQKSEQYASQIEGLKQAHADEVAALNAQQDAMVSQRTEAATLELRDETMSLRKKLVQRDEEIRSIREEITNLRKDKLRLTEQGGDKFLDRLESLGINFIAFHPGAGHLSIALADMTEYMKNPTAFAARKCKVSEPHYLEWLKHYQNPECQAPLSDEKRCCARIPKVDMPSKFEAGKSDRCDRHKVIKASDNVAKIGA